MPASTISRLFKPMFGLPCWRVKTGFGDCLTLEFGQPELHITEPRASWPGASLRLRRLHARRMVTPHGAWHLWIYCSNWRVVLNGKVVGDNSTHRRALRAAEALDGQALTAVRVDAQQATSTFEFDLSGVLESWPFDSAQKAADQQPEHPRELWMLYMPSGKVFSLRDDGKYCYTHGLSSTEHWKPLIT